jgi:uncharacterized metal-binding protein YceD (DUF177 family)
VSDSAWPVKTALAEVDRHDVALELSADEAVRKAVAKLLDLASLDRFEARVRMTTWLDGAALNADWSADLVQSCSLTLTPIPVSLRGHFAIRMVPPDSPNAPANDPEAVIDPDADDPPDVLETQFVPVGDYLVEHLALELDPFPRAPGAVFVPPDDGGVISPFAALKALKPKGEEG